MTPAPTTYSPTQTSPQLRQAMQRFGIVGTAPSLLEAVGRALRVAPIDLSVLVTGPSGAGKEFFPQIIHTYSPRKHARYIAVNCGAIPEGTIDSELFGHEKGSFTGALSARKGYFEEADGGTIFLDEVAELPLTTQARLLRVLESGEFLKVGSSTVQRTNIRIVAATNVDLIEAVRHGRFREDLYYRLSTIQIHVPPLHQRGNDIILLARKFATDFAERYNMPPIDLSDDARTAMLHYRWPGNVRQLKNIVEQMALFCTGQQVTSATLTSYIPDTTTSFTPVHRTGTEHSYQNERELLFNMIFRMQSEIDTLRQQLQHISDTPRTTHTPHQHDPALLARAQHIEAVEVPDTTPPPTPTPTSLVRYTQPTQKNTTIPTETLEQTERETIRRALLHNDGRRKETARQLNISERTLYRKIKEYGLE